MIGFEDFYFSFFIHGIGLIINILEIFHYDSIKEEESFFFNSTVTSSVTWFGITACFFSVESLTSSMAVVAMSLLGLTG